MGGGEGEGKEIARIKGGHWARTVRGGKKKRMDMEQCSACSVKTAEEKKEERRNRKRKIHIGGERCVGGGGGGGKCFFF